MVEHASVEVPLARLDATMAVFGVAATGAPVALITYTGEPIDAFANRLLAFLQAQGTTVFLIIASGDPQMPALFADLAKRAPDLRSVGLYHLAEDGVLLHVEGRHLGALEAAAKQMSQRPPLTDEALAQLVVEAQQKHGEMVRFHQQTRSRFPLISVVLGGLCVLVFFRFGAAQVGTAISVAGANIGSLVKEGQVWRWLSSAFLHGSQSHLLMNMLSLYFVGTFLEQVVGRLRYLLIYGLSALGGAMASSLIGDPVWSVGASGAIWGVMTAGYGLSLRPAGILPPLVAARIKRGLSTPLLINIGISFLPGIDLRAHFGGGAVGLLLALSGVLGNRKLVVGAPEPEPVPTPAWVKGAAVFVALLMAASLAFALRETLHLLSLPRGTPPPGAISMAAAPAAPG